MRSERSFNAEMGFGALKILKNAKTEYGCILFEGLVLDPSFSLVAVLMDVDILCLRLNLQVDGCHGLWVVHCCTCKFVTCAIVTFTMTNVLVDG